MNLFLSILQIFLAFHTAMGAVWKLSNSEQAVPSLSAIPHGVWMSLVVVEFFCALGLLLPLFKKKFAKAAPISAIVIAVEMLAYTAVHCATGAQNHNEPIYWLVVAAVCAVLAVGRLKRG